MDARPRRAEVHQKQLVAMWIQDQIGRLDILVDHRRRLARKIFQCAAQGNAPAQHIGQRVSAALYRLPRGRIGISQPLGKVVAFDIGHHYIVLRPFLEIAEDLRNRGVGQRRQRPGFAFETSARRLGILRRAAGCIVQ
jgi:hypothetical protein